MIHVIYDIWYIIYDYYHYDIISHYIIMLMTIIMIVFCNNDYVIES